MVQPIFAVLLSHVDAEFSDELTKPSYVLFGVNIGLTIFKCQARSGNYVYSTAILVLL